VTADPLASVEAALDAEGLIHTREDDGDALRISFKSEGDRYFVVAYRDDNDFLMLGSGWTLPDEVTIERALRVANRMNARKKFVKTALWEEERDVLFTVELGLAPPQEFTDLFVRLLDALRDTASDFFADLRRV
jgi:hypothetical protein